MVIAVLCVFAVLFMTGVLTYNDLLVKLGMADKPASDAELSVHFIDVGQGDSTLIICKGEAMLIDAGERDMGKTVVKYLEAQKIKELKYVVITHPHTDHLGGMIDVFNSSIKIDKVFMSEIPENELPTNTTYQQFLNKAQQCGIKFTKATDTKFKLGNAEIEMYAPDPKKDYESLNNYSIVTRLTHGDNTFLFTGDIESAAEKNLIKRDVKLDAKVLKVAHHGSSTSSTSDFLDAVSPRYSVIMCGVDNSYNHPNDKIVSRIKKYCENVFRTDLDGTVVFESDGEGINVKKEK